MIEIETLTGNTLEVHASGKLDELDFQKLNMHVDSLIRTFGTIQLLIDITQFEGWTSAEAAEKHFAFVREHHAKVNRIAFIASQQWKHWVAGFARLFVHPEIRVFDEGELMQAENWLSEKRAA